MIRLVFSIIILTLIITYLIVPLVSRIKRIGKRELKRIDGAFTNNSNKNKGNGE